MNEFQSIALRLYQAMFNASLNREKLDELTGLIESFDGSSSSLANHLAETDLFKHEMYADSLSDSEFAGMFADNLLGDKVAAPKKAVAIFWIKKKLGEGFSRGEVIDIASSTLAEFPATNKTWGAAARQFDNKVKVAGYYAIDQEGESTVFNVLQAVTANVNDTLLSVEAALARFTQPLEGVVVDGYVAGATVFVDLDGDGVKGPGEPETTTDAKGGFAFPPGVSNFGQIISTGGTDIATGKPFTGTLTAPAGSTVVNPLTTLISDISSNPGTSVETARKTVLTALGLDGSIDLSKYDPLANATDPSSTSEQKALALKVQAAAAQVNTIVQQTAAVLRGTGTDTDGIKSAYAALSDALTTASSSAGLSTDPNDPDAPVSDGTINLSSNTEISGIIKSAASKSGASSSQQADVDALSNDAATVITNLTTAINTKLGDGSGDVTTTLNGIATAQVVSTNTAGNMESGATSGNISSVVTTASGNNLINSLNDAQSELGDVDGDGESNATGVSKAPVANDDVIAEISEDSSVTFYPLANDSNVEDAVVSKVNDTAIIENGDAVVVGNGSVSLMGSGSQQSLTFKPDENYNGSYSFTYTLSSGTDGVPDESATVSGTVSSVNDSPTAKNDSLGTIWVGETGAVDVLANDSDIDENHLAVTHIGESAIVAGGDTVVVNNGSVRLFADGKTLKFIPDDGYTGEVSFSYAISDGSESATANVSGSVKTDTDDKRTLFILLNTMFGREPDECEWTIAVDALRQGNSIALIAEHFNNDNFRKEYPAFLTQDEFAARLVENLQRLYISLDKDTADIMEGFFQSLLDGGMSSPSVVLLAVQTLIADFGDDDNGQALEELFGDLQDKVLQQADAFLADEPVLTSTVSLGIITEGTSATTVALDAEALADGNTLTQVAGQSISAGGNAVDVENGSVKLLEDGKTLEFTPDNDYTGKVSFEYTISIDGQTETAAAIGIVSQGAVAGSITATERSDAIWLYIVMFGEVPTAEDLESIVRKLNSTTSLGTIAESLEDVFIDKYLSGEVDSAGNITSAGKELAVQTLIKNTSTLAAKDVQDTVEGFLLSNLANGASISEVALLATQTFQAIYEDDISGEELDEEDQSLVDAHGISARALQNKVDASLYYLVGLNHQEDAYLAGVNDILTGITDSEESLETAKDDIYVLIFGKTEAVDDTLESFDEDTTTTINVLDNDTAEKGKTLTLTKIGEKEVDAGGDSVDVEHGSVTLGDDGKTLTFTPEADFNGDVSFDYTISDGNNSDTGTVTGTVNAVNDAPVAPDLILEMSEDGRPAKYINRAESTTVNSFAEHIGIEIGEEFGESGIVYQVSFEEYFGIATLGGDDGSFVLSKVNGIDIGLFETDYDPLPNLVKFFRVENGYVGSLLPESSEDNEVFLAAPFNVPYVVKSQFLFIPDKDFFGETSFTYTLFDGELESTGTVTVLANPMPDAPVAGDDDLGHFNEDTSKIIDVLANDEDVDDDSLTITKIGDNNISAGGDAVQVSNGSVKLLANGKTLQFMPSDNYNGDVSFDYTVSDGTKDRDGLFRTDTATVSGTVNAVNDDPVAKNYSFEMNEDGAEGVEFGAGRGALFFKIAAADITDPDSSIFELDKINNLEDPDSIFSYSGQDLPVFSVPGGVIYTHGTFPLGQRWFGKEGSGAPVQDSITLIFVPDKEFSGTSTFTYSLLSHRGTGDEFDFGDEGTITIKINPINDAPEAVDDEDVIDEDSTAPLSGNLLTDDIDPDSNLIVASVNGNLVPGEISVEGGSLFWNADGDVEFVSDQSNFNGDIVFKYTVSDGNKSDEGTYTITVVPVNDAPVASNDDVLIKEDQKVTINVLDNDYDVDSDKIFLDEATSETGSVSMVDNALVFTPLENFYGETLIEYSIKDNEGVGDSATVTVKVLPVNDAPVANNDNMGSFEKGGSQQLNVLDNDMDVDGDPLSIGSIEGQTVGVGDSVPVINGNTTVGTVTLIDDQGNLEFTAGTTFTGNVSFEYTVFDGNGKGNTGTVAGTINAPAPLPPSPPSSTFIVTETAGVVEFSGTASGNITVSWAGAVGDSVATFTRGGIDATETPDFETGVAGTATSITLAAGQALSISAADLNTLAVTASKAVAGAGSVVLSDTTVAAGSLNTLDGAVAATINASAATTVTGTGAEFDTAIGSVGITLSGSYAATVSGTPSIANLNTIDADTTGVITATPVTDSLANLNTLTGAGNAYTLTINDAGSVTAADLNTLDGKTTVQVDATSAATATGTAAVLTTAANSAGLDLTGVDLTVNSGTATTAQQASLDGATTGVVTATISDNDMTTLAGLADVNGNNALTVTVTDASVAAAALNTLDGKTSIQVDASAAGTLTGAAADLVTATGSVGLSLDGGVDITLDILETATAAQQATLDGRTTGVITAAISDNDMTALANLADANANNVLAVAVTDASVAAADLNTLDGKTSAVIDASAVGTLTGSGSEVGTSLGSAGLFLSPFVNVTLDAASTANEVLSLELATGGTIDINGQTITIANTGLFDPLDTTVNGQTFTLNGTGDDGGEGFDSLATDGSILDLSGIAIDGNDIDLITISDSFSLFGGETISGTQGDDFIVLIPDGVEDIIKFAASAASNGEDGIAGFFSGSDKIDLSAFESAGGSTVAATGALTTTAGSVYYLNTGNFGDADSAADAATAFNAAAAWTDADAVAWLVITDDDSTSIFEWSDTAASSDEVNAGELTLVGAFDSIVLDTDILIA